MYEIETVMNFSFTKSLEIFKLLKDKGLINNIDEIIEGSKVISLINNWSSELVGDFTLWINRESYTIQIEEKVNKKGRKELTIIYLEKWLPSSIND